MKEICEALQSLIATALGSTYTVVYGYNKIPSDADLPLVTIMPVTTEYLLRGTGGLREANYTITITATVSIKKYLEENTNRTTVSHLDALVALMEDRQADRTPVSASILGVIQANLTLSNTVSVAKISTINYQENNPQSYLISATLTLNATEILPACT
jgi:hypothetical protein